MCHHLKTGFLLPVAARILSGTITMSTSSKALSNVDVVNLVLDNAAAVAEDGLSKLSPRFALVNKTFCDATLRKIWAKMSSLRPLFKIFSNAIEFPLGPDNWEDTVITVRIVPIFTSCFSGRRQLVGGQCQDHVALCDDADRHSVLFCSWSANSLTKTSNDFECMPASFMS